MRGSYRTMCPKEARLSLHSELRRETSVRAGCSQAFLSLLLLFFKHGPHLEAASASKVTCRGHWWSLGRLKSQHRAEKRYGSLPGPQTEPLNQGGVQVTFHRGQKALLSLFLTKLLRISMLLLHIQKCLEEVVL